VINQEKHFDILPIDKITDIENKSEYKKLEITSSQKIQMGGFVQQIPAVLATKTLAEAYILKFPNGISDACQLMQYRSGGYGTALMGETGIAGHASLYKTTGQAAAFGAFTAMSIASGQYFLAEINKELKTINQNIDNILKFLYGDKKAELLAEVSFAGYAYQNYSSIMEHEQQRLATLTNLQESKKVAMKDIEFYMSDLNAIVTSKNVSDLNAIVDEAVQIKDSLLLSIQLYIMSTLLEVYYSGNHNSDYICYVEKGATTYMSKCENRILSCFSMLKTRITDYKEGVLKKLDKPKLEKKADEIINSFSEGNESELRKAFRQTIHALGKKAEYVIDSEGNVYLKTG
jgi:hypothetical protein